MVAVTALSLCLYKLSTSGSSSFPPLFSVKPPVWQQNWFVKRVTKLHLGAFTNCYRHCCHLDVDVNFHYKLETQNYVNFNVMSEQHNGGHVSLSFSHVLSLNFYISDLAVHRLHFSFQFIRCTRLNECYYYFVHAIYVSEAGLNNRNLCIMQHSPIADQTTASNDHTAESTPLWQFRWKLRIVRLTQF